MHREDGFFPVVRDDKAGKLYLEVKGDGQDFLLLDHIPYGLGSNDVGPGSRPAWAQGRVVHFSRFGNKILLIAPNLNYRSSAADAAERIAVKESFAPSRCCGACKVEAEENGRYLIDATDFFLRDAHGVAERMQATGQGNYKLDSSRSAITDENNKRTSPKNTEVDPDPRLCFGLAARKKVMCTLGNAVRCALSDAARACASSSRCWRRATRSAPELTRSSARAFIFFQVFFPATYSVPT